MGFYEFTIYSVVKRNAKVHGGRLAWISGSQRITHRQFLEKVDQLTCGLLGVGLVKGDRIGVLSQNSPEFVYLYGAAAKIGAVMLPINSRLNPEEVEYIISDGSPKIIFIGPEFQAMIAPLISKFNFVKKRYTMGRSEGNFAAFNDLMENDGVCPEFDVHSDDPYVIFYTAAVAGRPRGAVLSQRGLLVSNLQNMYYLGLTEKDCNISMLPLFHVAGLGWSLMVMHAGGLNIIVPKFDVDLVLKHIQEDKVTILGEFPPMLSMLLDKAQEDNYDLSSLRVAMGMDHPDTIKRFEKMTRATFWTAYTQSETSGAFVTSAPYFAKPGSAGLPSVMAEVEIVDEYGNFVETEKPGEIVVRGPMVFKGYWNREKDNEYTFRGGWHHTGDMGRFDADGYLWYVGRKAERNLSNLEAKMFTRQR